MLYTKHKADTLSIRKVNQVTHINREILSSFQAYKTARITVKGAGKNHILKQIAQSKMHNAGNARK